MFPNWMYITSTAFVTGRKGWGGGSGRGERGGDVNTNGNAFSQYISLHMAHLRPPLKRTPFKDVRWLAGPLRTVVRGGGGGQTQR